LFHRDRRDAESTAEAGRRVLDLRVNPGVYERLKKRALADGVSVDTALVQSLERGMENCFLYSMWEYKQDFELIKRLTVQYERDNKVLKALVKETDLLADLAESAEGGAGG
jgi:hypothetical protein